MANQLRSAWWWWGINRIGVRSFAWWWWGRNRIDVTSFQTCCASIVKNNVGIELTTVSTRIRTIEQRRSNNWKWQNCRKEGQTYCWGKYENKNYLSASWIQKTKLKREQLLWMAKKVEFQGWNFLKPKICEQRECAGRWYRCYDHMTPMKVIFFIFNCVI